MSPPPEEDIRRTIARYCLLCDDGRFDEWADLFNEDATFHVMGRSHVGRAAIRAFIEVDQPPSKRGKHVTINHLIEVDGWGGTASAWIDFVVLDTAGAVTSQGRYHDKLQRGGDKRWRFTVREIVFRGATPEITKPPPA